MATTIPERVDAAREGTNPTIICQVPSGWVALCDQQFLRGYCILLADPVVASLNELDRFQRSEFLGDMTTVGDALLEVTGAYRINYAVLANSDPYLHAHIIPRYKNEPEELRRNLPWSHPQAELESILIDLERDRPFMDEIRLAIEKRL
jgi:diadenosine tetraphosphate (Ap4A) HIT family hydrolase